MSTNLDNFNFIDISDLEYVKKRLEMAVMKEEKRQEQTRSREEKKENDGRMICPLEIRSTKDLVGLKHLIEQYKGIQKQAAA